MRKLFDYSRVQNVAALEMIDHQTDSFARDVEVLFAELIEDVVGVNGNPALVQDIRIRKHPNVRLIEEKTFKRTGIKLSIITGSHLAAILPFYPNPKGIFVKEARFEEAFIEEQAKILDAALEHKGTVDIQKCKVTGLFSEYVAPMWLNIRQLLMMKMTPPEITAVFLHELGHAFTGCEYSNRLNSTNQVLAELLRDTNKKKGLPKEYIFKELKKINPQTTQEQVDKMMSGQNIILGPEAFKFIKGMIENQMPEGRYNENSFETLADNFAARWGYGEPLVGALERLSQDPGYRLRNSVVGQLIWSAGSLLYLALLIWVFLKYLIATLIVLTSGSAALVVGSLGAALGSFNIMYGLVGATLALLTFYLIHSTHASPMTYDDINYRYQRVRNQYVDLLKDLDLPAKQIKQMIDSIKAMDRIIANKKEYPNFVSMAIDFLTPGNRSINKDIEFQRLLESLSANDLYVKAAALRTV